MAALVMPDIGGAGGAAPQRFDGVTAGGVAKTVRSQLGAATVTAEAKGVLGGMLKGSGLKA